MRRYTKGNLEKEIRQTKNKKTKNWFVKLFSKKKKFELWSQDFNIDFNIADVHDQNILKGLEDQRAEIFNENKLRATIVSDLLF